MSKINLADLSWPVFRVGETEPIVTKGVTYFLTVTQDDEETNIYTEHIVDDKSLPGPTLSARRMYLLGTTRKLYALKRALFFISDLLKTAKSSTWFIDSSGLLFNYRKTQSVPLEFKKIKSITSVSVGGSIIEIHGILQRFKVMFSPTEDEKYAGVLNMGYGQYLLYGLYKELHSTTRRLM